MTTVSKRMAAIAAQKTIPVSVLAEITDNCNARCRHCYFGPEHVGRDLPHAFWDGVFRQLADLSTFSLTISGGEPLLHPELPAILKSADAYNFSYRLYSNGLAMTETLADAFAASKILLIGISLNSADEEINDAFFGVPGAFEKAIAAIEMLRERDVRVEIKNSLTRDNWPTIERTEALAEELGCKFEYGAFISAEVSGDLTPLDLRLTDDQLIEYMEYQYRDVEYGGDDIPDETCDADEQMIDVLSRIFPCGAGRSAMVVAADGLVYPCVMVREEMGDATETPLAETWKNGRFAEFRKMAGGTVAECRDCDIVSYCFRCPGYSLLEEGSLLVANEEHCRFARAKKAVLDGKKKAK
ncbi:MAG: radical SAM protein [bacterium]|nr:radical SAM protein [bacterium]